MSTEACAVCGTTDERAISICLLHGILPKCAATTYRHADLPTKIDERDLLLLEDE